ncbi:MAG: GNAT family N-acetyltransferase [Gammaproteobacteria bacterium]|nr:GNAT family N-acetyltransferase [Gammaproteobacteria bacterium]
MIETERLRLRKFTLEDAEFIFELVNTAAWLENIGDKKVANLDDAQAYIENGPLDSYHKHGYGSWLVELKDSNQSIGLCGYFKRDYLDSADIGYAFLPEYWRKGYAQEAAKACVDVAVHPYAMQTIYGICSPNNQASIRLLKKIGLQFIKEFEENGEVIALYRRDLKVK